MDLYDLNKVMQEVYKLLFKVRSGMHCLNEGLGRHRGREGKVECSLHGAEWCIYCRNVQLIVVVCKCFLERFRGY